MNDILENGKTNDIKAPTHQYLSSMLFKATESFDVPRQIKDLIRLIPYNLKPVLYLKSLCSSCQPLSKTWTFINRQCKQFV